MLKAQGMRADVGDRRVMGLRPQPPAPDGASCLSQGTRNRPTRPALLCDAGSPGVRVPCDRHVAACGHPSKNHTRFRWPAWRACRARRPSGHTPARGRQFPQFACRAVSHCASRAFAGSYKSAADYLNGQSYWSSCRVSPQVVAQAQPDLARSPWTCGWWRVTAAA